MTANFLNASIVKASFSLQTTELNGITGGAAATSSVGGASGVFDPSSDWSSAPWAVLQFKSGGSFTPVAGQALIGWFLQELDASNFESLLATPSTTQQALARPADFVIPLYQGGNAFASGNIALMQGAMIKVPWAKHKIVLQNFGASAVTLPSTGNILSAIGVAIQY